jgi:hypothetical protein
VRWYHIPEERIMYLKRTTVKAQNLAHKKRVREVDRETSIVQPMHMHEDNIKNDLKEAGCDGMA